MKLESRWWIARLLACSLLAACAPPVAPPDAADAAMSETQAPDASDAVDAAPVEPDAAGDADAGDPACAQLAARLQTALEQGLEAARSPAVWMAVLTERCGAWSGALAAPGEGEVRADQLLRIGSVTKTFTSAVVLQLADEGRLNLDDPLERWVEGLPNGTNITVRQLLNHTSGIFNYTEDARWLAAVTANPRRVWTPRELVDFAVARPPYFAPGAGWHYSNTGYVLLGMIAERAGGAPVHTAIRTRLLAPARLMQMHFDGPEAVPDGALAPGYAAGGGDVSNVSDPSRAWSAGAMVGTVGDMAAWAARLYAGDALSPAVRMQLTTFVDTGAQPGVRYGLGVFELAPSVALTRVVGHGGDINGYHVQMYYLPEHRAALAVGVNRDGASSNALLLAGLRVLARP